MHRSCACLIGFFASSQILEASVVEPLSLANLDVYSGGNLVVGWNATIDGSAGARGSLQLADQATVSGDLYAGGAIQTGWHSAFGAAYDQLATEVFDMLAVPAADTASRGGDYVAAMSHDVLQLAPGAYGDVSAAWQGNLALSAGEYYFDSLFLGDESRMNIDTSLGDVLIYVAGNVQLAWNSQVRRTGGGGALVSAGGSLQTADQSLLDATLLAGGPVNLGWNSEITGQVYSQSDITLASQAHIGGAALVSVPEPATVLLLGIGLLALSGRRSQRSRQVLN